MKQEACDAAYRPELQKRLAALEKKAAEEGIVLTDSQVAAFSDRWCMSP